MSGYGVGSGLGLLGLGLRLGSGVIGEVPELDAILTENDEGLLTEANELILQESTP